MEVVWSSCCALRWICNERTFVRLMRLFITKGNTSDGWSTSLEHDTAPLGLGPGLGCSSFPLPTKFRHMHIIPSPHRPIGILLYIRPCRVMRNLQLVCTNHVGVWRRLFYFTFSPHLQSLFSPSTILKPPTSQLCGSMHIAYYITCPPSQPLSRHIDIDITRTFRQFDLNFAITGSYHDSPLCVDMPGFQ